ncbi:(Fe-S)-binding protein [Massilia sp. W12]|uniref:(Fe-S)-binding protein n=1 Tax=Massilia sp. W12 TaxID=3126507 RepID=UPI0030CE7F35
MRVALFATCLVDMMRPQVGLASLALLEAAGCTVEIPDIPCCGQPAYNSGARPAALALAQQVLSALQGYDWVVLPSGSCAGMLRVHYQELLKDQPQELAQWRALAPRILELSEFLLQVAAPPRLPLQHAPHQPQSISYHDCCSGLRELGIAAGPRQLLQQAGVEIREMRDSRACCGFGGAFSLKYGEISAAICDEKCAQYSATAAPALVMGDTGCMLHIEGRMRRQGQDGTVLHYAQILAGQEE